MIRPRGTRPQGLRPRGLNPSEHYLLNQLTTTNGKLYQDRSGRFYLSIPKEKQRQEIEGRVSSILFVDGLLKVESKDPDRQRIYFGISTLGKFTLNQPKHPPV